MRKFVVGAVMMIAAAGCSVLGRQAFQAPGVTLRDVRVTGLGLTGGNLDVVLSVYNPNGYRLDATRMSYKVLVDTIALASGELTDRTTMQSKDSTLVHVPVQFTYSGLGEAGRQLMNTGAVMYKVIGDVTVGSPIGNRTVPFTATGRFTTMSGASR